MKIIPALLFFIMALVCTSFAEEKSKTASGSGFVADEYSAILIAEAILIHIYGQEKIDKEQPFHATLNGEVWEVRGTLPKDYAGTSTVVEISKKEGTILRIIHQP